MRRLDDLHRKERKIYQDTELFRFGVDAVLLAWFSRINMGESALDLCAGNGIVSILMEARANARPARFDGIELLPENIELAQSSINYNGLEGVVDIRQGDIRDLSKIPIGAYNVVTANPPYMRANSGAQSSEGAKAIARHELTIALPDVCAAASRALKFGGRAYIVHRPNRLTDLLCGCRQNGIEPKRLKFVCSHKNNAPRLLLLEAAKGGKPGIVIEPHIILYNDDGTYTDEVYEIYYGL